MVSARRYMVPYVRGASRKLTLRECGVLVRTE